MTLALLLSSFVNFAHAAECDVEFSGTASELLDAVSDLTDNEVLCIPSGTYDLPSRMNITDKTGITIRGDGIGDTIIQRDGGDWVINVNGSEVDFEDLTVTGELDHRVMGVENTSGRSASTVRLLRVRIEQGRRGLEGAGIRLRADNHLDIRESEFDDNEGTDSNSRGAHIYHYGGTGSIYIDRTSFKNGRAARGGAIAVDGASTTTTIERSEFIDNRADRGSGGSGVDEWGGGAVQIDGGTAVIDDCLFEDNISDGSGGAIYVRGGGSADLERNDFVGNTAVQLGGHIFAYQGSLTVNQARFTKGSATGGGGVACVSVDGGDTCTVNDSGFWFNSSGSADYGRGGGGLFANDSTVVAKRNLFCGNDVDISTRNDEENGGGAVQTYGSSNATLNSNVYMGNVSNGNGGAMLLGGADSTSAYETIVGNDGPEGAGTYGREADPTYIDSSFYALNECTSGGSRVVNGHGGSEKVDLDWSVFHGNVCSSNLGPQTSSSNTVANTDTTLPALPTFPLADTETCREIYDWDPTDGIAIYRSGDTVGATGGPDAGRIDADGDGWSWLFDCDDNSASIEGPGTLYADLDGDGFGAGASIGTGCPGPLESLNDEDCDDDDADVYPSAPELCDGRYNACEDEIADPGGAPDDESDLDNDNYVVCTYDAAIWLGSGDVVGGGDCNDDDDTIFPGATEICDGQFNDCSDPGYSAEGAPDDESDLDSDNYVECTYSAATWAGSASIVGGDDCDDDDVLVFPGATEICDGQYNDCDDADYDAVGAPDDEADLDGDLYVVCEYSAETWTGAGDIVGGDDCDDTDDTVYPSATEICDGQFNDCSDPDYDTSSAPNDEADLDGDDFVVCAYVEADWVGDSTIVGGLDCNDTDVTVYPGATEICDGQFNDCSDPDYDGASPPADEADADDDGYVVCEYSAAVWTGSADVTGGDDCDDDDALTYPGADEVCDGQYNDCADRLSDPGGKPDDEADLDDDDYVVCDYDSETWRGSPDVVGGQDCDDADAAVFPTATEICDGQFNDCDNADYDADGAPDDEADLDGDRWVVCDYDEAIWTGGDIDGGLDCDDDDPLTYPGATEIPGDGKDQSCSGTELCYQDIDGDAWRTDVLEESSDLTCTSSGLATAGVPAPDCDDGDPAINPDADEIWYDGVDQNCDGLSDYDQDFDGFDADDQPREDGSVGTDCTDTDPAINPDADEIWYDGVDQDCDGHSDYDQDFDGFDAVDQPREDGSTGDDCVDTDASVFPGARGWTADCEQVIEQDNSRPLTSDESAPNATGCDCDSTTSSGGPAGLLAALGLLAGLVRRRRSAGERSAR